MRGEDWPISGISHCFLADFRSFWAIEADFRLFRAPFAHSKGDIGPFRVMAVICWSVVRDFS